jgi:hypothetical protein
LPLPGAAFCLQSRGKCHTAAPRQNERQCGCSAIRTTETRVLWRASAALTQARRLPLARCLFRKFTASSLGAQASRLL